MSDLNESYEQRHLRNLRKYRERIKAIYNDAIDQVTNFAGRVNVPEEALFRLYKAPALRNRIDQVIADLNSQIYLTVINGIESEWELSNENNIKVLEAQYARKFSSQTNDLIFDKHENALSQFKKRKLNGLNLSDRVWNSVKGFRNELENGLSLMISEGKSSQRSATELKRYLNEPDRLFRRIRDAKGRLKLSGPAKMYNPGQGVYRSSFKNAWRLTRTETNLSYVQSDMVRWRSIPMVVGYEVKLSANHPRFDICDYLAGKYPKSFVFTKWHPQCLCYAVPILMTNEEFDKYEDAVLAGQNPKVRSINTVTDVPNGFKDWIKDNTQRVLGWKSQPYWVKENFRYGSIKNGLKIVA